MTEVSASEELKQQLRADGTARLADEVVSHIDTFFQAAQRARENFLDGEDGRNVATDIVFVMMVTESADAMRKACHDSIHRLRSEVE